MKVLLAATPLTGHVNPMVAIGRLLRERGDEVALLTSPSFAPRAEEAGLRFIPYSDGGAAEFLASDLPPGPERWTREFATRFVDPMVEQSRILRELLASQSFDLIVASSMFLGVLPLLLGSKPRPPIAVLNVSILFLDRPDHAPVGLGLPPAGHATEFAHYAALGARFDEALVKPVRAHADARLAELGLPPLPASLTQSVAILPDVFLQATVPSFEYSFDPLPPNLRFIGLVPVGVSDVPLPDWWPAADDGRKIVLVTQGTLANADFGQLLAPTLEALAGRDDLFVVATTGGRAVDSLPHPLPSNARVARYLPFDTVLPKVDVLVTNGGYGSVSQALRHGVPIVAAGQTEDKAEVSARIGWSGAGVNLATNTPTAEALRRAVGAVLDDASYRQRAAAIAADFECRDTRAEVYAALDDIAKGRSSQAA